MDNRNTTDREKLDAEELLVLKVRIIETCKHANTHFTIDTKQITDNINLIFGTKYTESQVNYVLGVLYEANSFYGQPETFEDKL